MRSPLTEVVQRVQGMIDYVRENLDDQEYDLFLDLVVPQSQPQVEKVKPVKRKKIEHCEVCNYTRRALVHKDSSVGDYHEFQSAQPKSKRARGLAAALNENLQQGKEAKVDEDCSDDNANDDTRCQFIRSDEKVCNLPPDHNIHHLKQHIDHHDFQSGKSHALAAGEGL